MSFQRYPHLEKLGNLEVEGIEHGTTYVFPKIDGTNAQAWLGLSGDLRFGSRNRELSLDNDNAGFMGAMHKDERLIAFFGRYPRYRLYGEWLVPHSFTGYVDGAWRRFYVFDVYDDAHYRFLHYDEYLPLLLEHNINHIPCYWKVKNGTPHQFVNYAKNCDFLLKQGETCGEGIVIKNYEWTNRHGRSTWAKVVTSEFKAEHVTKMGPMEYEGLTNEERIVSHAVTQALVDKEYAKIVAEKGGWSSKDIPRLLETVFYCVITEELWSALKKINYGSVNFKSLKQFIIAKVKELKPEVF